MRKQLLSLLALLLMAAGGAVAQNANSVNAREFTRTPSGTWMLNQMPGWSGQLEITLREAFRLDSIPLTWTVMVAGVDKSAQVTAYTPNEGPDTLGWLNVLEGDTVELVPPTVVKPTVKNVELFDNMPLPAATVITAPTATTGDIMAGSTTALVTAGTAEGGTMMYKVTTENTQPASTNGFSATVSTAASLTAGTYYVWYYVQGDTEHLDSEISATAAMVTVQAAPHPVDLSQVTQDYVAQTGDVLSGTLGANVKISIAAGASVTFDGLTINGVMDNNYRWAGITCEGDATITLTGTNSVKGFYYERPGIFVPEGSTLTIQGNGSLTARSGEGSSGGYAAGIGSEYEKSSGNIVILSGTITAYGGHNSAGIGGSKGSIAKPRSCGNITISGGTVTASGGQGGQTSGAGIGTGWDQNGDGSNATCGNITITGGTVTATGGDGSAGIGTSENAVCGTITIANTVTRVTATKGSNATNSIGLGLNGSCGTVTIGGTATGNISTSPYTYQP